MDKRELLKSMLNNLIHDKREESEMDFHNYLTLKSKEVTGISTADESSVETFVDATDDLDDSDDSDDAGDEGSV